MLKIQSEERTPWDQVSYLYARIEQGRCKECGAIREAEKGREAPYAHRCVRCQERERIRQRTVYRFKSQKRKRRKSWGKH